MNGKDIDKDFIDLIWDAGIKNVYFGTDGQSQAILDQNKKGYSLEDAVFPVNAYMRKKGFIVRNNYIIMTPISTLPDVLESLMMSIVTPALLSGLLNQSIGADLGSEFTNDWIRMVPYQFELGRTGEIHDKGNYKEDGVLLVPKGFTEYTMIMGIPISIYDKAAKIVHDALISSKNLKRPIVDVFTDLLANGTIKEKDCWDVIKRWGTDTRYGEEIRYLSKILFLFKEGVNIDLEESLKRISRVMKMAEIYSFKEYYGSLALGESSFNLTRYKAILSMITEKRDEKDTIGLLWGGLSYFPEEVTLYTLLLNIYLKNGEFVKAFNVALLLRERRGDSDHQEYFIRILKAACLEEFSNIYEMILRYEAFQGSDDYSVWMYLMLNLAERIGLGDLYSGSVTITRIEKALELSNMLTKRSMSEVNGMFENRGDEIIENLKNGKTVRIWGIPLRFFSDEGVIFADIDKLNSEQEEDIKYTDEELSLPRKVGDIDVGRLSDGDTASDISEIKEAYGENGRLTVDLFENLSENGRRTLLRPDVLSVFLGLRSACLVYDKEDIFAVRNFLDEVSKLPEIRRNFDFIAIDNGFLDYHKIRVRIYNDIDFLTKAGILTKNECEYFAENISNAAIASARAMQLLEKLFGPNMDQQRSRMVYRFLDVWQADDIMAEANGEITDEDERVSKYGFKLSSKKPHWTKTYLEALDKTLTGFYVILSEITDLEAIMDDDQYEVFAQAMGKQSTGKQVDSEDEEAIEVEKAQALESVIKNNDFEQRNVKDKKQLIVLLDTEWIRLKAGKKVSDDMNPLLTVIRKFFEANGIILIDEDDQNDLMVKYKTARDAAAAKNIETETVALIDSEHPIYQVLRGITDILLLGIQTEKISQGDYIRITELLNIAIRLNYGFEIDMFNNKVKVNQENGMYILTPLPLAGKLDPVALYRAQLEVLINA